MQSLARSPEIGQKIMQKLSVLEGPLSTLQGLRDTLLPANQKGSIGVDIVSFVQPVMAIVAPGVGQMLIFFGTLFFMLLGRSQIRRVCSARPSSACSRSSTTSSTT